MAPSPKLDKFQKRGVVRGKLVRMSYFQEQELQVFLEKPRAQGWLELFTNTQMGCSQPDVAEFYANLALSGDVLCSTVNGVEIQVNAQALGVILGVPTTGFALYVREDQSLLSRDQLLELSQHLSQQPGLRTPQAVKKGDMQPLHQLLFWFIIKNIIPRAQGRNQADSMDQCLIDLMDKGEPINLPAFMINHIIRIATTTRSWAVVLPCSNQVIGGRIRAPKHLVCQHLIAVEIRVCKHPPRLFLQDLLLCRSPLPLSLS